MPSPTGNSVPKAFELIKSKSSLLDVTFASHELTEPGTLLSKQAVAATPTLSYKVAKVGKAYLIIKIDLDAPSTSAAFLSPILHWLQAGLVAQQEINGGKIVLKPSEDSAAIAVHRGAGPPPYITGPHRYVFLLYEQPVDFDRTKFLPGGQQYTMYGRMRWDLAKFEKEAGLGPVIAANFYTCA